MYPHSLGYLDNVTDDFRKTNLWNHGLSELIKSDEGIKSIDAQYIRDHLMNDEFCNFVYRNANCSITRTDLIKELTREGSDAAANLFRIIGASDISWAIMVYLNNEEFWASTLKKKYPDFNSAAVDAPANVTRSQRKSKKSASSDNVESAEEDSTNQEKTVEQRWMKGCLRVAAGDGYNKTARLVYFTFKAALNKIPVDEWKDVWSTYWEEIKDEELKAKKTSKKRTTKNIWEDEDEPVELDLGDQSEQSDNDDDDDCGISEQ